MAAAIGCSPEIAAVHAAASMLPDVIGFVGLKVRGDWSWYNRAHSFKPFWLIPGIGLHVLIDHFWHKPGGGWHEWGYAADVMGWALLLAIGGLMYG
jgi:hypothetical protein